MKILFLSRWFPYPPSNGSKIRIFNLLRELSKRHEIMLLSFAEPDEHIGQDVFEALRPYCQYIQAVTRPVFQPDNFHALLAFLSTRPRSVVSTHSTVMYRLVEKVAADSSPDVVVGSQIDMAPYALAVAGVPKILEELELTMLHESFTRERHPLRRLRNGLTWWKLSHYVKDLLNTFDGCTVVSLDERKRLGQAVPGYQSVVVVPNGVDVNHYAAATGAAEPDTLIYSGALTYSANFDAMDYFLHEVFPFIQAARPGVKLFITGKTDGVPVHRLPAHQGVVFTGYLDDIRPAVAGSWASIVPLRVGGGTRLKILEALALGTPVVATSKGAEGLDLAPENEILIADGPADMARTILHLLGDPALRETLSRNGRRAVKARYDWPIIGQQLNHFIEQTVANGHKR